MAYVMYKSITVIPKVVYSSGMLYLIKFLPRKGLTKNGILSCNLKKQ